MMQKEECCGCYACYNVCPQNCIIMKYDIEGFAYPSIDKDKCVKCNLCKNVCPVGKDLEIKEYSMHAAYNRDANVRQNSSSGGIFYALAKRIIQNNGVVYGASFNSKFEVIHEKVSNISEINKLMRSKYVQSAIGDIYSDIKKTLNLGKRVLFCGTPCQVYGLKTYLGKDYKKLYLVDFVCHGVPSPHIFNLYIDREQKKYKSDIIDINFRDKVTGWNNYSVTLKFNNGQQRSLNYMKDLFFIAFMRDAILRPSCYQCEFKGKHRQSDLTLGDFWGVENVFSEMHDNKGVSLVCINSEKGKRLINDKNIKMYDTVIESNIISKYNKSFFCSPTVPSFRDKLFIKINEDNFESIIKKYCTYSLKRRVYNKIIRILRGKSKL